MDHYRCLLPLLTISTIVSCSVGHIPEIESGELMETYVHKLVPEAAEYVVDLQKAGQLPGVGKNDHGEFHVLTEQLWDGHGQFSKTHITFPVSLTVNLCSADAPATVKNVFCVTKESNTAKWRLDGAWRSDKHGKFIELK
jgi:hypothetical protein